MYNPLIIGITSGGALLHSFLLLSNPRKTNTLANKWLGFFILTIGLAMLEIFIHNLHLNSKLFIVIDLLEVSRFLSGPTIYLSILFFTSPGRKFKKQDLLHFVLFVLFLIYRIPHIITGREIKIDQDWMAFVILPIFKFALPLQSLVYLFLSYYKLTQHQKRIEMISSSVNHIDLSWLRNFLLVLAFILLIWFNLAFFNLEFLSDFAFLFYLAAVFFLAYFSLQQKEIYPFLKEELSEINIIFNEEFDKKLEKQKRLSNSQVSFLKEKLEHLMRMEKIYLQNDLNLPALSKKMEITSHELSYLINVGFGENFFSYINKFRIEEAKLLLRSEEYRKLSILGIALQVGFNSKTTFNTTFKKFTGQSPTEFIKTR